MGWMIIIFFYMMITTIVTLVIISESNISDLNNLLSLTKPELYSRIFC